MKLICDSSMKKFKSRAERLKAKKAERTREAAAMKGQIEKEAEELHATHLKKLLEIGGV